MRLLTSFLEVTSQILTVLSSPPDTARRPSGANWQARTQLMCPLSVHTNFWPATDQICRGERAENTAISSRRL